VLPDAVCGVQKCCKVCLWAGLCLRSRCRWGAYIAPHASWGLLLRGREGKRGREGRRGIPQTKIYHTTHCSNLKLYWLLCFISVYSSPLREGSMEGAVPIPQEIDFWVENGVFWFILGALFWCKLLFDDQKLVSDVARRFIHHRPNASHHQQVRLNFKVVEGGVIVLGFCKKIHQESFFGYSNKSWGLELNKNSFENLPLRKDHPSLHDRYCKCYPMFRRQIKLNHQQTCSSCSTKIPTTYFHDS